VQIPCFTWIFSAEVVKLQAICPALTCAEPLQSWQLFATNPIAT
jgi:hypothetical protein